LAYRADRLLQVYDQAFSYSLGGSEPDTDYLSFLETGISFRHYNGDFARAEIQPNENFRLFVHLSPAPFLTAAGHITDNDSVGVRGIYYKVSTRKL